MINTRVVDDDFCIEPTVTALNENGDDDDDNDDVIDDDDDNDDDEDDDNDYDDNYDIIELDYHYIYCNNDDNNW